MSYHYDDTPAWPFPILPVVIHQIEGKAATSLLPALVDTGADATLVPSVHLRAINAGETCTARLRSHWGESRTVIVHLVDLEVADQLLPAIEVIADDQGEDILLGRNVLNKLILLLDGPRAQTDVLNVSSQYFGALVS